MPENNKCPHCGSKDIFSLIEESNRCNKCRKYFDSEEIKIAIKTNQMKKILG